MDYPKVHKLIVLKTFDNDVFISADKAYERLEIKIDREQFDKIIRELKASSLIREHDENKGCYKATTLGEDKLTTAQHESERLPQRKPIENPTQYTIVNKITDMRNWLFKNKDSIIIGILMAIVSAILLVALAIFHIPH